MAVVVLCSEADVPGSGGVRADAGCVGSAGVEVLACGGGGDSLPLGAGEAFLGWFSFFLFLSSSPPHRKSLLYIVRPLLHAFSSRIGVSISCRTRKTLLARRAYLSPCMAELHCLENFCFHYSPVRGVCAESQPVRVDGEQHVAFLYG